MLGGAAAAAGWPLLQPLLLALTFACFFAHLACACRYGARLLGAFNLHYFTLEADLADTCACNLRDNPVAFGEDLQTVGPNWRCVAFMPWVCARRLAHEVKAQVRLQPELVRQHWGLLSLIWQELGTEGGRAARPLGG